MKNRSLLALVVLVMVGGVASAASVDGILRLCQAGVAQDIVVAAAKQSPSNLTVEQMLAVKTTCKGGDEVIRAIMARNTEVEDSGRRYKNVPTRPGIFIGFGDGREIEPTTFARVATGGKSTFKMAITGGLKKSRQMAELRGDKAAVRVPRQPSFVAGINPGELVLLRFSSRDGHREVAVGEMGSLGQSEGFREEDLIPFSSEKLGENRYRITLAKAFEPGEYALFSGSVDRGGPLGSKVSVAGSVYDFGVD